MFPVLSSWPILHILFTSFTLFTFPLPSHFRLVKFLLHFVYYSFYIIIVDHSLRLSFMLMNFFIPIVLLFVSLYFPSDDSYRNKHSLFSLLFSSAERGEDQRQEARLTSSPLIWRTNTRGPKSCPITPVFLVCPDHLLPCPFLFIFLSPSGFLVLILIPSFLNLTLFSNLHSLALVYLHSISPFSLPLHDCCVSITVTTSKILSPLFLSPFLFILLLPISLLFPLFSPPFPLSCFLVSLLFLSYICIFTDLFDLSLHLLLFILFSFQLV